MANPNPSPVLLLNRRVSDLLNETKHPMGSSLEPPWTPTLVQRVAGALAEAIIQSVANGEEVQLGKLGRFYPRVLDERVVLSNLKESSERIVLPKRLKLEFEPTPHAESRVKELFDLVEVLTAAECGVTKR